LEERLAKFFGAEQVSMLGKILRH